MYCTCIRMQFRSLRRTEGHLPVTVPNMLQCLELLHGIGSSVGGTVEECVVEAVEMLVSKMKSHMQYMYQVFMYNTCCIGLHNP
jgi:hypothetical protein